MQASSSKRLLRRVANTLVVLFGVLSILGTGGGGGGGDDTGGGTGGGGTGGTGGSATADHLSVIVNPAQLTSEDDLVSEGVTITVFAFDASNNPVENAGVTFSSACTSGGASCASSNSGGAIFPGGTVTDSSGSVSAVLTTAGDATLRTITVTVDNNGVMATVDVDVVSPGSSGTTTLRMGSFSGAMFNNGDIAVGIAPASLSTGGSTGLTVAIVDQSDTLFTQSVTVTFNSPCIAGGKAEIQGGSAQSTSTGTLSVTYIDKGCGGVSGNTDTVTASATANSQSLSATGDIDIDPTNISSLIFVSAVPTVIGLRGGGSTLDEQSIVTFKLVSAGGGPVEGATIDFSLSNTAGGITFANLMDTTTGMTDDQGLVTVTVLSGTVLTVLRVKATFAGPPVLTTQSSNLIVSTGFPDQNSFSISAEEFNIRAFQIDNVIVPILILASDRNNNPVPDGTPIVFTTEGGSIVGNCSTTNGECSVNWRSQNPRPQPICNNEFSVQGKTIGGVDLTDPDCEDDFESSVISPNGALRGGRTTILATTIGEESFVDLNANGTFDDGDTFTDLDEAFQDQNENLMRDPSEPFTDYVNMADPTFAAPGTYQTGDGFYNGQLCTHSTDCPLSDTFTVRESQVLVMSRDFASFRLNGFNINGAIMDDSGVEATRPPADPEDDTTIEDDIPTGMPNGEVVNFCGDNDIVIFRIVVRDANFQPMPVGTTVAISTTLGATQGTSSFEVQNTVDDTKAANTFSFALKGPTGMMTDSGIVEVTVSPPDVADQVVQFPATFDPAGTGPCP